MSIVISFGSWTKPYIFRSSVWAVCLGFVTITIARYEITDLVIEERFPELPILVNNDFIKKDTN
jgi:hypothetical protein